jgi:hypothetical protein
MFVLFLVFFCSTILFSSKTMASAGICGGQGGFDYAQSQGMKQGWLVPYNGENQSFTGIPCKASEPSDLEINSIVSSCCNGGTNAECLQKKDLTGWVVKYPTCTERNLVVQQNMNGKLEAFDSNQENVKEGIQSTTPTNQPDISGQNEADSGVNQGFLTNIWTKFVLFLRNLVQR